MKSSRSVTTPDKRLVVHVPQLEALLREAETTPPLIRALVQRGRVHALDPQSPQGELVAGKVLPAAPLTRRVDRPADAAGAWMRADPIGLVTDLAAVWLQSDRVFDPDGWYAGLSGLLEEEGLRLDLVPQGRGYVRLEGIPECRFSPPWSLAGNSLEHCLPDGPDARFWRRLLNETQVFLTQYRRGVDDPSKVPGSLWFWGGGSLPEVGTVHPRVARIVADDPVLCGMAEWLGLECGEFGASLEASGGDLVEWPARHDDDADSNLERLQCFLRPAWRRLRRGGIRELELAGMTTLRRFTTTDAWRVWR